MAIVVKEEHVQPGIEKYEGKRDQHCEKLLSKGKLPAEVYAFKDGRYLVKYSIINRAFLYASKQEFMEAVDLL